MIDEIKLKKTVVDQALTGLSSASENLDVSFSSKVKGRNVLDLVEKFHEIEDLFEDTLVAYQDLLSNNMLLTKQVVDKLDETDEVIASKIELIK